MGGDAAAYALVAGALVVGVLIGLAFALLL